MPCYSYIFGILGQFQANKYIFFFKFNSFKAFSFFFFFSNNFVVNASMATVLTKMLKYWKLLMIINEYDKYPVYLNTSDHEIKNKLLGVN